MILSKKNTEKNRKKLHKTKNGCKDKHTKKMVLEINRRKHTEKMVLEISLKKLNSKKKIV
jgi:hypothetical protein